MKNDATKTEEIPDYEPGLVEFTSRLTEIEDPDEASRIADMLLLFLTAGGTVLGCILAAIATLALFPMNALRNLLIVAVLGCVGLGGGFGFLVVAGFLHMKGMVRWERRRPKKSS